MVVHLLCRSPSIDKLPPGTPTPSVSEWAHGTPPPAVSEPSLQAEMGFNDTAANQFALEATKGDLEAALSLLAT